MGISSYDRIIEQIVSNTYLKAEFKEAHMSIWTGHKVHNRSLSFSQYDRSYSVSVRAKNDIGHTISMSAHFYETKKQNTPYLQFPWLSKDVMKSVLSPHWKKTIKTYNIPLNKFVDKWHDNWGTNFPNNAWPELLAAHEEARSHAYELLNSAVNDDFEEFVKQSAFDFIMEKFASFDFVVRKLSIDEIRSLAELEQIRRIHQ